MTDKKNEFCIRSKIWIEDGEGEVVFGLGRYRILDAVERYGFLHAASKELGMSYRAAWCRIQATEQRMGKDLLYRQRKGSTLTPTAQNLMKKFRRLQKLVESEADDVFSDLMLDEIDTQHNNNHV